MQKTFDDSILKDYKIEDFIVYEAYIKLKSVLSNTALKYVFNSVKHNKISIENYDIVHKDYIEQFEYDQIMNDVTRLSSMFNRSTCQDKEDDEQNLENFKSYCSQYGSSFRMGYNRHKKNTKN